jgi:DHA1 family inner membrane transport protein
VLQVAPGSADLAAAGAVTAVNIGITVGALGGSVLLPGFGVRSTALVGGVLSLAALVVVLGEPLLVPGGRGRKPRGQGGGRREPCAAAAVSIPDG